VDQWGSWADVLWLSGAVEYCLWISGADGQVCCGSLRQLGKCTLKIFPVQLGGKHLLNIANQALNECLAERDGGR
jgi:hypothetical protein